MNLEALAVSCVVFITGFTCYLIGWVTGRLDLRDDELSASAERIETDNALAGADAPAKTKGTK